MPLIRRWQDINNLVGDARLTPAEQQLIKACKTGEPCTLGDGKLPLDGTPSPERKIRADLLRYLILGGCEECNVEGWGVMLTGAYVTGELDLSFAVARGVTRLMECRFDRNIIALQTRFELVNLTGSAIQGLKAQRAKVAGSVYLRRIIAKAEVGFVGSTISGQLDCEGARFEETEGIALNAQGANVAQSVSLRGVTAKAKVEIKGATIGGQLDCEEAHFDAPSGQALNAQGVKVTRSIYLRGITAKAEVKLNAAIIGGQLSCTGARFEAAEGRSLNAQRMKVVQGLIWREITTGQGVFDFSAAQVGDLADDPECWPEKGKLILDGFTYDRITSAPTDAKTRIAWLEKGSEWNGEFYPQPFTQLANVLREMGHDSKARNVLFRREQLLRRNSRAQQRIVPNGEMTVGLLSIWRDIKNGFQYCFDLLLRRVVGYGHRPFRSLWLLVAFIGLAIIPAHFAYEEGSFAPNSGPVLVSNGWLDYHTSESNPAKVWSGEVPPAGWTPPGKESKWKDIAPGRDWQTFNRYAYAVDLVIPIIDIGQTSAWAPSTTRGWWGKQLWWLNGVLSIFGWIVTALGAAAITGLIRRD